MFNICVLIAQKCLTLSDPVDCSPPGSSVHGILQARILEWAAYPLLHGIVPNQGLNSGLLHRRWILYSLSHQGSPYPYREPEFFTSQMVLLLHILIRGKYPHRISSSKPSYVPFYVISKNVRLV